MPIDGSIVIHYAEPKSLQDVQLSEELQPAEGGASVSSTGVHQVHYNEFSSGSSEV